MQAAVLRRSESLYTMDDEQEEPIRVRSSPATLEVTAEIHGPETGAGQHSAHQESLICTTPSSYTSSRSAISLSSLMFSLDEPLYTYRAPRTHFA